MVTFGKTVVLHNQDVGVDTIYLFKNSDLSRFTGTHLYVCIKLYHFIVRVGLYVHNQSQSLNSSALNSFYINFKHFFSLFLSITSLFTFLS
jgi:hypothetical protein